MAYLKEKAKWEDGIYQYELDDPLQGGEDGIDNVQGKQLANRTAYLKEKFEMHEADNDNPHNVTAEQVGSYTKQETDRMVKSLNESIDTQLNTSKAYTNNLFISLFENSGYIQWPGLKSPLEIPALHFEGYSWYEVNYRGNFFRAKGDNAKPFSSKKLTKEQIKNGAYIFKDDEQGDAIRNIKGSVGSMSNVLMSSNSNKKSPPWSAPEGWAVGVGGGYTTYNSYARDLRFDASTVVPTTEENRPRNLTFVMWALVKDE